MIELTKTFDPVRLSFIRSVLADEGIEAVVLDQGASAIWPGAIPSRVMVGEDDENRARRVLREAGIDPEE